MKREFDESQHTQSLIAFRQTEGDLSNWTEVKRLTKDIKKKHQAGQGKQCSQSSRRMPVARNQESQNWICPKPLESTYTRWWHRQIFRKTRTSCRTLRQQTMENDNSKPKQKKYTQIFSYITCLRSTPHTSLKASSGKFLWNWRTPGHQDRTEFPFEFYKWLRLGRDSGEDLLTEILKIPSKCVDDEEMPEDCEKAQVVTLYKKGNVEDPSNYRPTSLLQAPYKIYLAYFVRRPTTSLEIMMLESK